jgi:hypothetical protein
MNKKKNEEDDVIKISSMDKNAQEGQRFLNVMGEEKSIEEVKRCMSILICDS